MGGALSRRTLHAVDDVTFDRRAGDRGAGRGERQRQVHHRPLLARVYKPTSGAMFFAGSRCRDHARGSERLRYSGQVPMVFQDPFSSINPVFRVAHGMLRA